MGVRSKSIERRVQWMDTDAAGIWHHSVMTRWAEEAEAELHRHVGVLDETFGVTPRVRVEYDLAGSLRFDDLVSITLTIAELGNTSITYLIEVRKGDDLVASGKMIAVLIDGLTGQKKPWPEHLRRALEPGP